MQNNLATKSTQKKILSVHKYSICIYAYIAFVCIVYSLVKNELEDQRVYSIQNSVQNTKYLKFNFIKDVRYTIKMSLIKRALIK